MRNIAYTFICLLAASQLALAQSTVVNMDSGSHTVMNFGNTDLTAGPVGDGNGAVLQLGYFTGATNVSSNFAGTWVPLTGQGSANTAVVPGSAETYNQTSIGDRNLDTANMDGTFVLQLLFGAAPASSMNLPPAGTILSIRFYNGTTIANSTFYNTVSNDAWVWAAPNTPPPTVAMSLDDPNLEWESIVLLGQAGTTAFHTTIPVPEPSTYALLGLGGLGGVALRRRVKR